MLLSEEKDILSRLADLAGSASPVPLEGEYGFDRDHVTVLMSLLRSGADLDRSLEFAPGLASMAEGMVAAYACLESARSRSVRSWERALSASRPSAIRQLRSAALLMPSPSRSLRVAPGAMFSAVQDRLRARSARLAVVEREIYEMAAASSDVSRVASTLFDPVTGGLFRTVGYVPDRVSALSPEGVESLLPPGVPCGRL